MFHPWMENDIIQFWLFAYDTDRVLDIEDDEYFDEYNIDHYSTVQGSSERRCPCRPGSCFSPLSYRERLNFRSWPLIELVFTISLILYILLILICILIFPVIQARFPRSILRESNK